MAFLALSVDEIALLRFTCDLSFNEEGPLYFVEREQKIPTDMERAYHNLIAKKVIDPETFRLTDSALNRIAPIVECDARVVHLFADAQGKTEQKNFYLLDDIAVNLIQNDGVYALGDDLDIEELCEHFARRLLPRRAFGEHLEFRLTEFEFIAFSRLAQCIRPEKEQLRLPKDSVLTLLGDPPRSQGNRSTAAAHLPQFSTQQRLTSSPIQKKQKTPASWQKALEGLIKKEVFLDLSDTYLLRPALFDFVTRLKTAERHTFSRCDFDDDEWFMRETTFIPTSGGLFFVGADPEQSEQEEPQVLIFDVNAERLKWALESSLGGLARYDDETLQNEAPRTK